MLSREHIYTLLMLRYLDLSKATFYKYLKLRGVSISADNYRTRYKPPTSIIIDKDKE